ncbi:TraB/GumN family protein [Hymenobacter weizhouensis]|uniref:TraB/GumN family protein n=1 Tax=Hymenobacter sp. YIM 151500-1 TaxID=2987689 RepID=UPI0022266C8A|nr:TraB/GumN family protein [Hymenobacter sp. YIM 151500-1]UYZ62818.1 TraB/GumN family protein [Hymenobacter sp. YIM 151500-1]
MQLFHRAALAAALLLSAFSTQAQKVKVKAKTETSASAAAPANSLLWEVSGKNLSQPSYIYGTIHLICPQDLQITEPTKRAFTSAQQVVMELDMDSPTLAQEMQAGMLMGGGQTLEKLLPPADYARVGEYLQAKAGLPVAQVGMLKPFIVSSILYPALLGCKPASYETTFVEMAKAQQKEVTGLETVQEQLGFFEKIPYPAQSKMLADMVLKEAQAQQEFQQMLTLYKAQNVEGLRDMTSKSSFGFREYESLLLDERNQQWIARIEKQAAAKPTFFAVGAAHLGGPKGVLNLLRQQGYQVRPVVQ